jgi:glycosyltransferase involved in cell wall biosynthesis
MGFPESKITVIPLAPNEAFRPVSRVQAETTVARYGLRPSRYFLHVGTIEPRKNLLRLLRAFERISRADPQAPDLVFIGGSGWRNREFYRAVETSPARSRVRLLGYLPEQDLAALYSASMATVYPSLYEGFGLPPLEAMACGAPVVTSNTSSLPEVVGDAALLVDPSDVGAIEAALVRVKGDPELRETLGYRGLQRARQFSWDITARRTLEVYGVAGSPPAEPLISGLQVA